MSKPKFKVGESVARVGWEFAFAGTVVAVFKVEHDWLYVVQDGGSFPVVRELDLEATDGYRKHLLEEVLKNSVLKHGETVYLCADEYGTPLTAIGYFFRSAMFIAFKNGVHGENMIHHESLLTRKNPRLLQDPQSP